MLPSRWGRQDDVRCSRASAPGKTARSWPPDRICVLPCERSLRRASCSKAPGSGSLWTGIGEVWCGYITATAAGTRYAKSWRGPGLQMQTFFLLFCLPLRVLRLLVGCPVGRSIPLDAHSPAGVRSGLTWPGQRRRRDPPGVPRQRTAASCRRHECAHAGRTTLCPDVNPGFYGERARRNPGGAGPERRFPAAGEPQ